MSPVLSEMGMIVGARMTHLMGGGKGDVVIGKVAYYVIGDRCTRQSGHHRMIAYRIRHDRHS